MAYIIFEDQLAQIVGFKSTTSKLDLLDWLEKERQKKKPFYRKTKTGLFIAYCSKCGKKHMPNNEFQIREGSSCCRVDYVPDKPNSLT